MMAVAEMIKLMVCGVPVADVERVTFGTTEVVKRGAVVNGWTFEGIVDGKSRWVRDGEARESPPAVVFQDEENDDE